MEELSQAKAIHAKLEQSQRNQRVEEEQKAKKVEKKPGDKYDK
jgi:hypothetical protein